MKNAKLLKEIKKRKLISGKTLEVFEIINKYDGITSMEVTRLFNQRHRDAKTQQNVVAGRISELAERGFVVPGDMVMTKSKRQSRAWHAVSEMPAGFKDLNKDKLKKKLEDRKLTTVSTDLVFDANDFQGETVAVGDDKPQLQISPAAAVLVGASVMEKITSFFKRLFA